MVEALVSSAQRLIAERGAADVALREIAEDAGVNFGLVYQYIGTKEQLLSEVYRRAAANAAAQLEHVEHLDDAVDLIMRSGDGTVARLIAWAALEDPGRRDLFGSSPPSPRWRIWPRSTLLPAVTRSSGSKPRSSPRSRWRSAWAGGCSARSPWQLPSLIRTRSTGIPARFATCCGGSSGRRCVAASRDRRRLLDHPGRRPSLLVI